MPVVYFSGDRMKGFVFLGAVFCFLGVLGGALGAHALREYLIQTKGLGNFALATDYMFYHGLGLIFVGFFQGRYPELSFHLSGWLFIVGTILFQGNLYLKSVFNFHMIGMLTPLGGICLMAGWLMFAFQALKIPKLKN